MKIALGSDHRGVAATRALTAHLQKQGHQVTVLGDCSETSSDYPDSAFAVGHAVSRGQADVGILACSNGVGMSIAANKVKGIRAVLAYDEEHAKRSRQHNDANVLCLGSETASQEELNRIVDLWLKTDFEGGRHERRVNKIMAIERGEDPTRLKSGSTKG
jgi:ribose 5-phosphate isomerase B